MTRSIRLMVVSAMSLGLAACGGAKLGGGKEGAAQAAFQASQSAGRGHTKTGQALIERALASNATLGISLSANCSHGGSASLAFEANANPFDTAIHYAVSYDDCNEDGVNEYNGTLKMSFGVEANPQNFGLYIAEKGELTIDGDISDSLDIDVKMTMDVSATSANTGSVKLVLDGTIETSSGRYVYTNETLSITAGELPKA
jgi:hypothetical protein